MISNRPESGRTFQTAIWTVGVLAFAQFLVIAWAMIRRPAPAVPPETSLAGVSVPPRPFPLPPIHGSGTGADVPQGTAPLPGGAPPVPVDPVAGSPVTPLPGSIASGIVGDQGGATVAPASSAGGGASTAPLPGPNFLGPAGAESASLAPPDAEPASLSEMLTEASFSAEAIEDPILERLISAAQEHRSAGNMQQALNNLRKAEEAIPEHPRVMSELAATFQQMGLDDRADIYWERIQSLGKGRAGSYYEVADRQLRGETAPAAGDSGRILEIGEVIVEAKDPTATGQQVTLRIVVDGDPASRPNGEDLALLVYFYDRVDGSRIEASTADTSYFYPTEPYDWQTDGTEMIGVNYSQPEFTEEQRRELGERVYYGYAIELYYLDELQDRVIVPEDIAALRQEVPEDSVAPVPPGPDNALFPDSSRF